MSVHYSIPIEKLLLIVLVKRRAVRNEETYVLL